MKGFTLLLFVGLLLTIKVADCQKSNDFDLDVSERIIYDYERYYSGTIHSQGFGIGFCRGRNLNAFKTRFWNVEISNLRSLKRLRSINPYYLDSKSFVYGKLNDVFVLRFGYGVKKQLNRKPSNTGVEVRWLYEGGASLAIQKPYYYYLVVATQNADNELETNIETGLFEDDWLDIYGRAPFLEGIEEVSLRPGLFARTALYFEFGSSKTKINALELGANIELFPQGVSIIYSEKDKPYFITFYLTYSFGKRFNKY